jgi:hypothetical protein
MGLTCTGDIFVEIVESIDVHKFLGTTKNPPPQLKRKTNNLLSKREMVRKSICEYLLPKNGCN